LNAFSLVANSDSAEFLGFSTTLRFSAGVAASVAAGFAGIVTLMNRTRLKMTGTRVLSGCLRISNCRQVPL